MFYGLDGKDGTMTAIAVREGVPESYGTAGPGAEGEDFRGRQRRPCRAKCSRAGWGEPTVCDGPGSEAVPAQMRSHRSSDGT